MRIARGVLYVQIVHCTHLEGLKSTTTTGSFLNNIEHIINNIYNGNYIIVYIYINIYDNRVGFQKTGVIYLARFKHLFKGSDNNF